MTPPLAKPKAAKWLFTWIILFHNMCLVQPDTYNKDLSGIMRTACWFTVHDVGFNPYCYTSLSSSFQLYIFIGTEMLAVRASLILWPSCSAIIWSPTPPLPLLLWLAVQIHSMLSKHWTNNVKQDLLLIRRGGQRFIISHRWIWSIVCWKIFHHV